jgi:hypothetical protein
LIRLIYLLEQGLLFGWKKPVIWIPKDKIRDLGIECVTGRTFDFRVEWEEESGDQTSIVFGMFDQGEYDGIRNSL